MRLLAFSIVCLVSSGCAGGPSEGSLPDSTTAAQPSARPTSSARKPRPSTPQLALRSEPGCEIVVDSLLEANVFRGSPQSQATLDAHRANPEQGRLAAGIDHGAEYLSCTWRVRVNDKPYRYKRASHGGPASGTLHASVCSDQAEAQATASAIYGFTDACSDLRRAEYYGDILEPLVD